MIVFICEFVIRHGQEKDLEGGKQSEDEVDHETTVVTPFNMGNRNLPIRP